MTFASAGQATRGFWLGQLLHAVGLNGQALVKAPLSLMLMTNRPIDLGQVRLDNAMALFDEFVRSTARHADAATLRGLERRFAERVQIQPSYWSQIKSRSRQIGERLARQFEVLCHKPRGWMDLTHAAGSELGGDAARDSSALDDKEPLDDDERFIVGLVLTYYRRHPQRARTRLLDLLGEVLVPSSATAVDARIPGQAAAPSRPVPIDDGSDLWRRTSGGVAPLRGKK